MNEFGTKLRKLRNAKNVTADQLADFLGVTRRTVINYESAGREPNINQLIVLANFFDVSLDALVGRKNKQKVQRDQRRPILYIDVDGVLLGMYDGHPQPRPNIIGFLSWAVEHFECRWMTSWTEDRLGTFMTLIHGPHLFKKIQYFEWHHKVEKDDAIDTDQDFFWIEDGPVRDRLVGLVDVNGYERYIEVDGYGRDELYRVQAELAQRLEKRRVVSNAKQVK